MRHAVRRSPAFLAATFAMTLFAASFAGPAHALQTQQAPVAAAEAAAAPITAAGDGPYVMPGNFGWNARRIGTNRRPILETIAFEGRVRIAPVGEVPAFTVPVRAPVTAPARDVLELDPKTRLMVLADTHGEYEIVHAFLRKQGVIDAKMKWSFGRGHLVVTGDMFDRGPHQLEILWLLYKLDAEARRKGGAVHVLLGNHESMVLRGDLRYLHPRYPEVAAILGVPDYSALFGPETALGNWLRSRPAVLKLGDLLLMHGGISPQILDAKLGIADLNAGIHAALGVRASESKTLDPQTQLVAGSNGPQWYRGYFGEGPKQTPEADIDRTLSAYEVSRILVGHTVVDKVTPFYGGKVIAVQVYPRRDETTGAPILEGALRENGRWYRATAQGLRTPLP